MKKYLLPGAIALLVFCAAILSVHYNIIKADTTTSTGPVAGDTLYDNGVTLYYTGTGWTSNPPSVWAGAFGYMADSNGQYNLPAKPTDPTFTQPYGSLTPQVDLGSTTTLCAPGTTSCTPNITTSPNPTGGTNVTLPNGVVVTVTNGQIYDASGANITGAFSTANLNAIQNAAGSQGGGSVGTGSGNGNTPIGNPGTVTCGGSSTIVVLNVATNTCHFLNPSLGTDYTACTGGSLPQSNSSLAANSANCVCPQSAPNWNGTSCYAGVTPKITSPTTPTSGAVGSTCQSSSQCNTGLSCGPNNQCENVIGGGGSCSIPQADGTYISGYNPSLGGCGYGLTCLTEGGKPVCDTLNSPAVVNLENQVSCTDNSNCGTDGSTCNIPAGAKIGTCQGANPPPNLNCSALGLTAVYEGNGWICGATYPACGAGNSCGAGSYCDGTVCLPNACDYPHDLSNYACDPNLHWCDSAGLGAGACTAPNEWICGGFNQSGACASAADGVCKDSKGNAISCWSCNGLPGACGATPPNVLDPYNNTAAYYTCTNRATGQPDPTASNLGGDVCVPNGVAPQAFYGPTGGAGSACTANAQCSTGLTCQSGKCAAPASSGGVSTNTPPSPTTSSGGALVCSGGSVPTTSNSTTTCACPNSAPTWNGSACVGGSSSATAPGSVSCTQVTLTSTSNTSLKVTVTPSSYAVATSAWTYQVNWTRTRQAQGSIYINGHAVSDPANPSGSILVLLSPSKSIVVTFYSQPGGQGIVLLRKHFTTLPATTSTGSSACK